MMRELFAGSIFTLFNILLEVIYLALLPILIPVLSIKRYLRSIYPRYSYPQGGILIHAASVGEVMAIRPLLLRLIKEDPNLILYLSTTTVTGLKVARQIDPRILVFLSPLDLWHLRMVQISRLKPILICIVETEIWLNLLRVSAIKSTPVLILNARMSDSTLRNLMLIRPFLRYASKSVKEIVTQSRKDYDSYKLLFNCPITNSGNLKFAVSMKEHDPILTREELGYAFTDRIIVWGSSRPGEELLARQLFTDLKSSIPSLKLIIAIRHPKRSAEVRNIFADMDLTVQSHGDLPGEIHIIDVIGLLDKAYAICDLAIVGGSFYDFGGHNPLEPAYYSKPVLIGPYHHSCLASVKKLTESQAIIVSNKDDLCSDAQKILEDMELSKALGKAAKHVLIENSRSMDEHLAAIRRWM